MNVMGIIYCWTNKITGKKYIGQTIHPNRRIANHKHSAFELKSDYYFHRSLRKRGLENFTYEILEECENLSERETYWIQFYNTIWPNGYNQIEYGNILSEEIRKKISKSQKKRMANRTIEQKIKHSENSRKAMIGKKQTENQKQKARESNQKIWSVTLPNGDIKTIINLHDFCRKQGLGNNGQSNLTRGKYKGYKAIKIN